MNRRLSSVTFSFAASSLALFLSVPAWAQPSAECPPGTIGAPIAASDICKARVVEFETRMQQLGDALCSNPGAAATKTLEEKVAKEFGAIATDCGDAFLASEVTLTQTYLHSWLSGPSEGWGDDLKVHGVKLPESLRNYREYFTNSYGSIAADKLPGWYKTDAAYAEAVNALLTGAREQLKSGSSYAMSDAETKITRFQTNAGLPDTDPKVKFLKGMLARLKTPTADAIPKELLAEYAKNPPVRLNGAAGFYTQACNKDAAKDDSLADGLALAWAAHLGGNGPGSLEKMESAVGALKPAFTDWSRGETAFGSEMTGAYMSKYVKDKYFKDDRNVADASPAMARSLADSVNGPAREKFGLPKIVSSEKSGDAIGMAGTKFDSNDNLRMVFPGKCELVSARNVNADGTTGEIIMKGSDWDPRGIYDVDSFAVNKDFPISELVFREPKDANKNKNRQYDITMKCGGVERKYRTALPPRQDSTDPIDFVTADTAPPYDAMLKDGKLNGMLIGGQHTREGEVMVKAMKESGFKEVSRKNGVKLQDRFMELLKEKNADGTPKLDYFVKDAHANGYAFDAGMFRVNKTGIEVVMEKRGPDGKKHTVVVLGNAKGEGDVAADAYETVEYARYFDAVNSRGADASLFVGNFSCWSDGKSAFEMDGLRNKNVKYMATDVMSSYWESYWNGISDRENTFQIIKAMDKKMTYAEMKTKFDNMDEEILFPDDPTWVPKITEKIKNMRSGDSGIPVRVNLETTRPVS